MLSSLLQQQLRLAVHLIAQPELDLPARRCFSQTRPLAPASAQSSVLSGGWAITRASRAGCTELGEMGSVASVGCTTHASTSCWDVDARDRFIDPGDVHVLRLQLDACETRKTDRVAVINRSERMLKALSSTAGQGSQSVSQLRFHL